MADQQGASTRDAFAARARHATRRAPFARSRRLEDDADDPFPPRSTGSLEARDAETRLVCAGFGVDLKRKPYADRVAMPGATVLARPGSAEDAPAAERSLPLYGYDEGPRVLVEYVVRGVAR